MAVAPSLSVVAKIAAPCCTSAMQMAVSLQDAAQCNGVLGEGGRRERPRWGPQRLPRPTPAARGQDSPAVAVG